MCILGLIKELIKIAKDDIKNERIPLMRMPLVSIIIIGYNIEKYIEDCISSALNQEYSEIEIIIVDDGSKDNTLKKIRFFQNCSNIKIVTKENGGIVSARKEGLKNSTGEFVCFVDGDDWLNSEMISTLMKRAEGKQFNVDIVSSSFNWQTAEGDFFCVTNKLKIDECKGYDFFMHIMLDEIDHHMFPRLYRKQFLIAAGYYSFCNVSMAEDLMTNALVGLHQPRVLFSDSVNYYYRFNMSSTIRNGTARLLEQAKTLNLMSDYIGKVNYPENYKLIEFQWFSYAMCYIKYPAETSIKKQIISLCKMHTNNIFENEYILNELNELPKRYRILFEVYYKYPLFAGVVDPIFFFTLNSFKKVRTKKRVFFEKKFFDKMGSYYQEKTNQIKKANNNVYLIATSDRSNIGDHAIALSEYKFLQAIFPNRNIIEITGDHYRHEKDELEKLISMINPIFITGGGFLGDLWKDEENLVRDVISRFPNSNIVVFPQTIYFSNIYEEGGEYELSKRIYRKHRNLLVLARENKSWHFLKEMLSGEQTGLFPDMALMLDAKIERTGNSKIALMCFRKDKECAVSDIIESNLLKQLTGLGYQVKKTSTLNIGENEGDILIENREIKVKEKIMEFSNAEIIITDRLHGMILATLAGTRCVAMNNTSRKVEGVYNSWLRDKYNVIVVEEACQLHSAIAQVLNNDRIEYDSNAWKDLKAQLEYRIKKFIREAD